MTLGHHPGVHIFTIHGYLSHRTSIAVPIDNLNLHGLTEYFIGQGLFPFLIVRLTFLGGIDLSQSDFDLGFLYEQGQGIAVCNLDDFACDDEGWVWIRWLPIFTRSLRLPNVRASCGQISTQAGGSPFFSLVSWQKIHFLMTGSKALE